MLNPLYKLPNDLYRFIIQKWVFPSLQKELRDRLRLRDRLNEHTVIRGNEKAWSFFGQHIFYSVEQVNRLNRLNILKETLVKGYF